MDKEKNLPYPTTIMLELNNLCNLKCKMCPREHKFGKDLTYGHMEPTLAYKILDETLPYLQSVGFTGMGETLFAKNLLEISNYIKERKKSVVIFISTNANMPDFIERIQPVLPYIDTVQISIDGVGEVYEDIRIGGTFGLFKENLKKFMPLAKENNVDVMFNMVVSKNNYKNMSEVIEFAADNGVPFVNFNYINLVSIPEESLKYYKFFNTEEFKNVLREARNTAAIYPDMEVTGLVDFNASFPGHCNLLTNHFQINYDGEVPPCCAKPFSKELTFGNVKTNSLIDVINSDVAKRFRKDWKNPVGNKFCYGCHFSKMPVND